MDLLNLISYFGLWFQPLAMYGLYHLMHLSVAEPDITEWGTAFLFSFLPSLYVWSLNSVAKRNGKEKFGILDAFYHEMDPSYQGTLERRARNPVVDKDYLSPNPDGIIFGKIQDKYVRKVINEDGHVLIIGGSGSGKSSCVVIPTLLINDTTSIFAIDIKGELSSKSKKYGDEKTVIFNPNDRRSYGYDPFYRIRENATDQEIMECMQTVSCSLIPMSANLSDPYWKQSARTLLTGLLIFFFKKGVRTLPDITKEILKKPMKEVIENAVQEADENSVEVFYLNQFKGLADETLSGVASELTLHITIFATNQNIQYALRDNPLKMNPQMLEDGKCIFLSIKEEKLSAYYDLMQLIINQTLAELEGRPEDSARVLFIIDELPRILSQGKIERLLDGSRTLRSRRVTLVLVTQSVDSLLSAYRESEVDDLISNCPYLVILSAATKKTQEKVIGWAGKYPERRISYNDAGGKNQKRNVAYEDKDIVDERDLIQLSKSNEAIVIAPKGYIRIKKCPYYMDRTMKEQAEKIIAYNKEMKEMEVIHTSNPHVTH